jgi:hypothetical protein
MNCKGLHAAAMEGVLSDNLCMIAQNNAPSACGCIDIDLDNPGDLPPPPVEEPASDDCPSDPNKTAPGSCGCGIADTHSDGDGTADCHDGCPFDSSKIEPGECGCGQEESTCSGQCEDRYPDCGVLVAAGYCSIDAVNTGCCGCSETPPDDCPSDPNKTSPGSCGCGTADTDSDDDGALDCHDSCPSDSSKAEPGSCGCGVIDVDSDDDGTPDCHDSCASDSSKTEPGECGCGQDESSCSDQCVDRYPDCSVLVATGYCSIDAVSTGCCGCNVQCVDRYPDCSVLVATGYCSVDAVKEGCCGCGDTPPPSECEDKSTHCSSWASQGACTTHADYMSAKCCASCE